MNNCKFPVEISGSFGSKREFSQRVFSQATRHSGMVPDDGKQATEPGALSDSDTAGGSVRSKAQQEGHPLEKTRVADNANWREVTGSLTAMQLRQVYPGEANTHRNMLHREKSRGAVIHPEFRLFRSFLGHVGPVPTKGATLDRINNDDPEYAPGKVRWADRRTQNNNKSDTLILHSSRTGEAFTVSRLAKLQSVPPTTIRKRLERGWTDDEIIDGRRRERVKKPPRSSGNTIARYAAPQASRPPMTLKELEFAQRAEEYRQQREEDGTEAICASYEDLCEILGPKYPITPEGYERTFTRNWPGHRPHVNYRNLPASQQALIAKIDPEYVEAVLKREALQQSLREAL